MLKRMMAKMKGGEAVRIVCYGDSISEVGRTPNWFGGASRAEMNWGQQLRALLMKRYPDTAFIVEHFGVGGQNAYEGLGRFDWLRPFNPDLVLIEFGANDCGFHFLPPDATALAISSLIHAAQAVHGADVIVMAPGGDNPAQPTFRHYAETFAAMRAVAGDQQAPFADTRGAMLKATENGRLWAEYHNGEKDCHPNDKGMAVWALVVMETIEKHLPQLS
jgi:lysophospholipase L1-like esterase